MEKFKLGDFEVDPLSNSLRSNSECLKLPHRAMSVLVHISEQYGETVSRKELLSKVWNDVSVSNEVLTRAIADLRKGLNDSASSPKYIQTVTGKGIKLLIEPQFFTNTISNKDKTEGVQVKRLAIYFLTLFTLVVVAFFLFEQSAPLEKVHVLKKFPLHSQGSSERFPRFSKSGRYIISTRISDKGKYSLILFDIEEKGEITVRTSPNKFLINGGFSEKDEEIFFKEFDDTHCELRLYNLISKLERKISECQVDATLAASELSTSRHIFIKYAEQGFEVRDYNLQTMIWSFVPKKKNLYFVQPRLSHDYTKVLFVKRNFGGKVDEISVFDFEKLKEIYKYKLQSGRAADVAWGEGGSIYFSKISTESSGIYKLEPKNNDMSLVLSGEFINFDYSKEAKKFIITEQFKEKIMRSSTLSKKAKKFSPDFGFNAASFDTFTISNDFESYLLSGVKVDMNQLILVANKGAHKIIASSSHRIQNINWSPDENWISYLLNEDKVKVLHIARTDSKVEHIVHGIIDYSWLSEDEVLYTSKYNKNFQLYNLNTKTNTEFPIELPKTPFRFNLVGKRMFFQYEWYNPIWSVDLDYSLSPQIQMEVSELAMQWHVSENHIAFFTAHENKSKGILKVKRRDNNEVSVIDEFTYNGNFISHVFLLEDTVTYLVPSSKTKNRHFLVF